MKKFLILRLFGTFPALFGVSILIFGLVHAIPGSPWDARSGVKALHNIRIDDTSRAALDERFGLDRPLWQQYLIYVFGYTNSEGRLVCGAICGNLGPSLRQFGRSIQEVVFQPPEGKNFWYSRFGYTARLVGLAFLFTVGIGIPLGVLSVVRQGTRLDSLIEFFILIGSAVPNYIIGLLLLIAFATWLHLIPVITRSWENPKVWILPALVLSLNSLAGTTRLTRNSLLEVIHKDFVRTARAKGLRERRVVWVHIFKNALIPILTYLGPALVEMIAASFIIEMLFGFPGFGREYWESVDRLDYSMIMGATLIYAVLIMLVNLGVDVLYRVVDPRIRMG